MSTVADQSLKSIAAAARHDLKQSLHVVSLYLQLAQQQLPDDHAATEAIRRAVGALEQQRLLTRRLRQVAEVPAPVKGRADLVVAAQCCAEGVPGLRLQGDFSQRWVPLPAGRLQQILTHLLAAAGASEGEQLTVLLGAEGERAVVTVRSGRSAVAEPSWTEGEAEAEHWLARRLAVASGARLEVTATGSITSWRLLLP